MLDYRPRLTENVLDDQLIVLLQLAERAPEALPVRDGILLVPAAAGVLVEVIARVNGVIYAVDYGRRDRHAVFRQAMRAICNNSWTKADRADRPCCSITLR